MAAMRPNEVSEKLKLSSIAKDHVWKVEPSCATTGEGIFEGLVRTPFSSNSPSTTNAMQAWLSNNVKVPPTK